MLYTNAPIDKAEFIILDSFDEMIALHDLLTLTNPEKDFRGMVDWLISSIIEMCFFEKCALEELDTYLRTNYFMAKLPHEVFTKQWNIVIVHASGGAEVVDRRTNKRHPREIVEALARNIWTQLKAYQLYDHNGNLMFEHDRIVPFGSMEIRLRRL